MKSEKDTTTWNFGEALLPIGKKYLLDKGFLIFDLWSKEKKSSDNAIPPIGEISLDFWVLCNKVFPKFQVVV